MRAQGFYFQRPAPGESEAGGQRYWVPAAPVSLAWAVGAPSLGPGANCPGGCSRLCRWRVWWVLRRFPSAPADLLSFSSSDCSSRNNSFFFLNVYSLGV